MPDLSFDAALDFARDLIRIPSPPGEEGDVADRVLAEFERLGFDEIARDEAGNVSGRIRGTGGGSTVMLCAHMDVVAVGDPAGWEHPPFEAVVEGGFLHGRGAMDIKGPLALMTYAAARMRGRLPGDVVAAHTVFEERGGLGMKHLMERGVVRPDAIIIGEATHGDLCIGHRGRAEVEVVVRGRAGHASAPDRAANPVDLLPAVLEAIRDGISDQPTDAVLGPATAAVTDIRLAPTSRNVIPDTVIIALDWRILPGMTADSLCTTLEEALARRLPTLPPDRTVEVRMATERQTTYTGMGRERTLLTPGFLLPPDHPVTRAAAAAVGRREGDGPAALRPWTFATDGGWSCGVHGVPTVGFAPGEERFAHTNRERLSLDEARWAWDRYPALIEAVMGAVAAQG